MHQLLSTRLWTDETGATAIEYAGLLAIVALAMVALFGQIGESLFAYFSLPNAGFADVNR